MDTQKFLRGKKRKVKALAIALQQGDAYSWLHLRTPKPVNGG
ncbi:hypothetical protein PQG02_35695 (plasmid) [Nostoc sp. UHCC 0926]|nr:hypothetical protein [Nostoc sp. UHCC 0926]WDD36495.1 hypothetical protein PQG02_35695 [Nostoc sp. UHCC 0926]